LFKGFANRCATDVELFCESSLCEEVAGHELTVDDLRSDAVEYRRVVGLR
jgi:hypothetical protein